MSCLKFRSLVRTLILLLVLAGCGAAGLQDRQELRRFFLTGAYDNGLQFIEKSNFYSSEKEKLLLLMEKGMLLHLKGDWTQSTQVLNDAKELASKLYTVSISKKAEKVLLNDAADIYYGEIYERSMIYFYLSLNAILNYQSTKKREDLFKARAEVLAWDSFLSSIKEDRLGKTIYKNDLLLKLYGAKIHEMMGTVDDDQIASILYKDAKDVLFKNYNTYPTFNLSYKEFKKDYEKLASLSRADVEKNYIKTSDLGAELLDYIEQNIERLKNRNRNLAGKSRVTFLLQKGVIAEKIAQKHHYGLESLSREPMMAVFVADVLGLLPAPTTYNPGGAYLGVAVASAAMSVASISFELPKVANHQQPQALKLIVTDKDQKIVANQSLALVNPLGDIAEEAIYEQSAWAYTRLGTRLALKHAAAIATAFATYKAAGGNNDFMAKNAAVISYAIASKAIENSEQADTRYWSTLPNELRLLDLELAPGRYELSLQFSPTETVALGAYEVASETPIQLINIRKN